PALRPWVKSTPQQLRQTEDAVLAVVNSVLSELAVAELDHFCELFALEEDFLITLPELDHYPDRGAANFWGPVLSDAQGVAPIWPGGEGKKIFAYLKPSYPHFETLLGFLSTAPFRTLVYPGSASAVALAKYRTNQLAISAQPVDIVQAAGLCDVALCHAGHGTCAAMLLAGCPLLLLPMQVEQFLLARSLVNQGMALVIDHTQRENFSHKLEQVLEDPAFKTHARAFSAKYQSLSQHGIVQSIVTRCEALANH
ncbi:MAG: glycosyltransferase, partial [Burkholderiales bacterium]